MLGLSVRVCGQAVEITPAKDSTTKQVNGQYVKLAWFGGSQQVRVDLTQAEKIKKGKHYEFDGELREFKGEKTLGYNWRFVGEVDASGNPIK